VYDTKDVTDNEVTDDEVTDDEGTGDELTDAEGPMETEDVILVLFTS